MEKTKGSGQFNTVFGSWTMKEVLDGTNGSASIITKMIREEAETDPVRTETKTSHSKENSAHEVIGLAMLVSIPDGADLPTRSEFQTESSVQAEPPVQTESSAQAGSSAQPELSAPENLPGTDSSAQPESPVQQDSPALTNLPETDSSVQQELPVRQDLAAKSFGGEEAAHARLRSFLEAYLGRLRLIEQLPSAAGTGLVPCMEHEVRGHENGIGWDILIRTPFLTPLSSYLQQHPLHNKEEVDGIGKALARALEECRNRHIPHNGPSMNNVWVEPDGTVLFWCLEPHAPQERTEEQDQEALDRFLDSLAKDKLQPQEGENKSAESANIDRNSKNFRPAAIGVVAAVCIVAGIAAYQAHSAKGQANTTASTYAETSVQTYEDTMTAGSTELNDSAGQAASVNTADSSSEAEPSAAQSSAMHMDADAVSGTGTTEAGSVSGEGITEPDATSGTGTTSSPTAEAAAPAVSSVDLSELEIEEHPGADETAYARILRITNHNNYGINLTVNATFQTPDQLEAGSSQAAEHTSQTQYLGPGDHAIFDLETQTTGVTSARYTVSAEASPVVFAEDTTMTTKKIYLFSYILTGQDNSHATAQITNNTTQPVRIALLSLHTADANEQEASTTGTSSAAPADPANNSVWSVQTSDPITLAPGESGQLAVNCKSQNDLIYQKCDPID